ARRDRRGEEVTRLADAGACRRAHAVVGGRQRARGHLLMALLRRLRNGSGEGETTLFFATDLHGSEVCFRKFVAAASFYGADLLVLGGDLTGRLVTPVVQNGQGWWSEVHGRRISLKAGELDAFEAQMADEGVYTRRM